MEQNARSNFPQSPQILSESKFADFNGGLVGIEGEPEGFKLLTRCDSAFQTCTFARAHCSLQGLEHFGIDFLLTNQKKLIHNVCLDYNYYCMKYSLNALVQPPTWFKCYESINYCLETGYNRYWSRQNVLGVFSILVTNVVFYSVMFFSGIKNCTVAKMKLMLWEIIFGQCQLQSLINRDREGELAAADFAI